MPYLHHDPPFIFGHVPKTGGTWLKTAVELDKVHGMHGPPRQLSYQLHSHRVVAQIRDPWSWYGSLYLHLLAMGRESSLVWWGDGSSEFADVLYGWTHLEERCQDRMGPLGVYEHEGPGEPPRVGGLWTWFYRSFLGEIDATLVDLAQAPQGWTTLLDGPLPDTEPANVRGSADYYRATYTDDLRAMVAAADDALIAHCGYTFLGSAAAGPTIHWPQLAEG